LLAELLNKLPSKTSQHTTNGLPAPKSALPSSDKTNFPNVKFWSKKAFKKCLRETVGDTDALATARRKRGRPKQHENENSDDDEGSEATRHQYLEDENGRPVSAQRMW
jgi:hypothetical protein